MEEAVVKQERVSSPVVFRNPFKKLPPKDLKRPLLNSPSPALVLPVRKKAKVVEKPRDESMVDYDSDFDNAMIMSMDRSHL